MKVTRTFNKAQEIFKTKVTQSVNKQNSPLSKININPSGLTYKKNLSIKLYKLYKYNKFFLHRLKPISKVNISFSQKNIKYYFLNKIFFIFNFFFKIKNKKNRKFNFICILNKIYFYIKKILLGKLLITNTRLKNFYFKLKKIFFVSFFEYQIFLQKKLIKVVINLKNKSKILYFNIKNFESFNRLIFNLKMIFLKEKELLEKLIINFNFQTEIIKRYIERLKLIILIYSLPLIILIKNLFIYAKYSKNITITKYFSPYINNLNPNLLLNSLRILDFPIFITYYSLFCTTKNDLPLKKETIYHGVFCTVYLLINTALSLITPVLDFQKELFSTVMYSLTILTNIYFKSFILKNFRGILLSDFTSSYGICEYDNYLKNLFEQSRLFLNSSLISPIFLILTLTLLYNCCYYIVHKKQPYIPALTNLAKRLTPNVQKD